jgi:hypothetical protein
VSLVRRDDRQNMKITFTSTNATLVLRWQNRMDSSSIGEIYPRERHRLPVTRSFKAYDYLAMQGPLCNRCNYSDSFGGEWKP